MLRDGQALSAEMPQEPSGLTDPGHADLLLERERRRRAEARALAAEKRALAAEERAASAEGMVALLRSELAGTLPARHRRPRTHGLLH